MEKGIAIDLPRWPSGGNRRNLEGLWLSRLELPDVAATLLKSPAHAPQEFPKAVGEFNRRLFWECHETLEDVWHHTPYPLRFFYHAIIKVAVGFHHLSRHNRHGARVKLSDGVRLLHLFQPHFLAVRTDLLLVDCSAWLARINANERLDWAALETLSLPTIETLAGC